MSELERKIEELKAELQATQLQLQKEKEAAAALVQPIYQFVLVLFSSRFDSDRVFDDSCSLYELRGRITNKEELKAVGKSSFHSEGSMRYLFNSLSGKFVMSVSGGVSFIQEPEIWDALSAVIREFPEGGDVTHIVNKMRQKGNDNV